MNSLADALEKAHKTALLEPAAPLVVATPISEFVRPEAEQAVVQPVVDPVVVTPAKPSLPDRDTAQMKADLQLADRLMAGYNQAVAAAQQIADPKQQDTRLKQLSLGRIRKSKVIGINSPDKVINLIMDCSAEGSPLSTHQHGDVVEYRFRLPAHYRAYARCIKLSTLLGISRANAKFVEMVPFRKPLQQLQVKLQAPQLNPFATDVVVFKLNEQTGVMEDWHAGDDPALHPASSLEDSWVHCGVDLNAGE